MAIASDVRRLRKLGLNCDDCGAGRTARFKVLFERGSTRRIDHSRTRFVCARHLQDYGYRLNPSTLEIERSN